MTLTTPIAKLTARLAGKVKRVSRRVLTSVGSAHDGPPARPLTSPGEATVDKGLPLLVSCAEAELKARAMRKAFLPTRLLGEPAWDILLELFVQAGRMKRVSIARACAASGVPEPTALRWLALLEQERLIERTGALGDSRESDVQLADAGLKAVSACLHYRAALPL